MAISTIDNNGVNLGQLGNRNLIINGSMQVAQRGTSLSLNATQYLIDRFRTYKSHTATATASQSSDAPTGFTKSWLITIGTGAAASAANELQLSHQIEGYNTVPLGLGASGAKDFTVSFWVKSSLTGDFSIAFQSQAAADHYITTYNISAANTWEYKTITISGPTSGSFNTTNATGLAVVFDLGSGSNLEATANAWSTGNKYRKAGTVAVAATSSATWQITGVQLEVGDTATPFEHRSYGDQLAACQRYLYRLTGFSTDQTMIGAGYFYGNTTTRHIVHYPVTMRVSPSVSANGLEVLRGSNSDTAVTLGGSLDESIFSCGLNIGDVSTSDIGEACILRLSSSTSSYISFDAEV
jgi:hypothetical protein